MRHAVARFVKYPMKAFVAPLVLLFVMASYAVAQDNPLVADPKHAHPAPRTSIVRFAQLDDGIYKGSKPKTDADYRFLQSKNVRYILDLKFFPVLYRLERRRRRSMASW